MVFLSDHIFFEGISFLTTDYFPFSLLLRSVGGHSTSCLDIVLLFCLRIITWLF